MALPQLTICIIRQKTVMFLLLFAEFHVNEFRKQKPLKIHKKILTMSGNKEQIKFSTMCRLCMDKNVLLVNLHPKNGKVKHSPSNILDLVEKFTTVKIDPLDNLPQKICESCVQTINSMLAFRNKCKRSNEELHKMKRSLDEATGSVEFSLEPDEPHDKNTINEPDLGSANEPEKFELKQTIDTNEPDDKNEYTFKTETFYRHDLGSFIASEVKRLRSEKVAICHICGKLYDSYKLQFHINHHNGLKPYECDETNCASKFASPHDLKKHKKICHLLEPLLFCDVCGRGFKVKMGLEIHRSYHFDPKLPCKICDKLFRNTRALNKHMLVHSQERKFKCDICGKSYQTRYTLRIHKRVHTLEKPYSCHCGVSFAYKCLLKTHKKKYHKDETQPLPSSS